MRERKPSQRERHKKPQWTAAPEKYGNMDRVPTASAKMTWEEIDTIGFDDCTKSIFPLA